MTLLEKLSSTLVQPSSSQEKTDDIKSTASCSEILQFVGKPPISMKAGVLCKQSVVSGNKNSSSENKDSMIKPSVMQHEGGQFVTDISSTSEIKSDLDIVQCTKRTRSGSHQSLTNEDNGDKTKCIPTSKNSNSIKLDATLQSTLDTKRQTRRSVQREDLASMVPVQHVEIKQEVTETIQPVKRKRGRPPKVSSVSPR